MTLFSIVRLSFPLRNPALRANYRVKYCLVIQLVNITTRPHPHPHLDSSTNAVVRKIRTDGDRFSPSKR
jgi:hypothetical protein